MRKDSANISASVRARLQNKAREANRPYAEVLQYYGMERFLYRFSRSSHVEAFVLKGALLFTAWQVPDRRTTLDIDFLARYDNQAVKIESVMRDVCAVSVEPDGLAFDADTVQGRTITEAADYQGVRVKCTGFLEKSRIPLQIDVGFGDIVYPKTQKLIYPVLLDFPKPRLNGYPPECVISEKFEAMVTLGQVNSRMKDFYDIWLLMRQFDFEGTNLQEALRRTFIHRKTDLSTKRPLFADEIYDEKSDRQTLWAAFLRKNDILHASDTLSVIARDIEDFLNEPITALANGVSCSKKWDHSGTWT